MKVLFYSTNSNFYSQGKMVFKMFPSCFEQWNNLKQKYPQLDFVVVMQKPGMFLYDDDKTEKLSKAVKYIFVSENLLCNSTQKSTANANSTKNKTNNFTQDKNGVEQFVDTITLEKPDIAIAVTYWTQPFDWLSIKDSLIAERLLQNGIKTICHPVNTSAICFDKYKTHQFFCQNGFNHAKGVYVHYQMFWAQRSKTCISENVYREYVFSQMKKLKYPVVIKDTLGLSSYGMDVVNGFEEAKNVLLSKKNNGDRLVEEFLRGESYGLEVYGTDGKYEITSPLINSVNHFGLTSPKQNVKLGPVDNNELNISELKQEVMRLANLLHFSGIAQIDLLYSNNKWYFIEINSRISGMTQTMAASMQKSLYELILFSAGVIQFEPKYTFVMNLKFPLLIEEKLKTLREKFNVYSANQIENHEAKQLREAGYSEVIFGQTKTLSETMQKLEELKENFPSEMETIFYNNAKKLCSLIFKK